MKIIILAFFVITSAHATSPNQILDVHKKYCSMKVKGSCEAVQCFTDVDSCMANSPRLTPAENKAMDALVDKCKQEVECLKREVKSLKEKAFAELGPKCDKGDKEACYAKEVLEVSP